MTEVKFLPDSLIHTSRYLKWHFADLYNATFSPQKAWNSPEQIAQGPSMNATHA